MKNNEEYTVITLSILIRHRKWLDKTGKSPTKYLRIKIQEDMDKENKR